MLLTKNVKLSKYVRARYKTSYEFNGSIVSIISSLKQAIPYFRQQCYAGLCSNVQSWRRSDGIL